MLHAEYDSRVLDVGHLTVVNEQMKPSTSPSESKQLTVTHSLCVEMLLKFNLRGGFYTFLHCFLTAWVSNQEFVKEGSFAGK